MSDSRKFPSYSVPCYFCNDSFEEKLFQAHIQLCGAVLQECSLKCGAYIPRRSLRSHERQCSRQHPVDRASLPRNFRLETPEESQYREKVLSLLNVLRTTVREAESERRQIMVDVAIVKSRLTTIEDIAKSVHSDFSMESSNSRKIISSLDQRMKILDRDVLQVEGRTRASFEAVSSRLDAVQASAVDQRERTLEIMSDHEEEIKELKQFIAKESVLIGDVWDEHKKRLNDLKLELEMRCRAGEQLVGRHEVLSGKLEGLVEELQRHGESFGKQERMIKTLKHQMKDVIKCVDDLFLENKGESRCCDHCDCRLSSGAGRGRLLWRIDGYKERMTAAKENDVILFSPVFFSREYGYALRMKLYLNGRDRWRDRNVIGCLQVVEGPWDPLLDWPCVIRASVTLRDQDNPANNVRKIVKTRANSKGDEAGGEQDSVIDMFIPHTVLTRYDGYTRNNVIFIDIQITEMRESLSSSSLIA